MSFPGRQILHKVGDIAAHPQHHRPFSLSAWRHWQYSYLEAIKYESPYFATTPKPADVNMNKGTQTSEVALPIALHIEPASVLTWRDQHWLDKVTGKDREELEQRVAAVPKHESELTSEADVIRAMTAFYNNVLEIIVPVLLKHSDFPGKIEWYSNVNLTTGERKNKTFPDFVLVYDGDWVVAFDYKAPNAYLFEKELAHAVASQPKDARKRLKEMTPREEVDKEDAVSLLQEENVPQRAERLVQQLIKYGEMVPFVAGYDYRNLLMLHVPPLPKGQTQKRNNMILEGYISEETHKSNEGHLCENPDNHISASLRFILRALKWHLEHKGSGAPPKKDLPVLGGRKDQASKKGESNAAASGKKRA